jgi:hypothetical protein
VSCCPVGKHKQRSEIETLIASCDDDLAVADRFRGVTRAAVKKHRAHMPTAEPAPAPPPAPAAASSATARVVPIRGKRAAAPEPEFDEEAPASEPAPKRAGRGITDEDLETAYRRAVRLLEALERLVEKLEGDALASHRDLLGAYKELRESITLMARLTRELGPEREVVIVQSPQWKKVEAALFQALRAFPEAAKAAGKALQALEEAA